MWRFYDELLELVDPDLRVLQYIAGIHWNAVESERGTGLAMTSRETTSWLPQAGSIKGRPLRELASQIKSWNPSEAALGLAAVNAAINIRELPELEPSCRIGGCANVFEVMKERIAGRKVAVIGHFRNIERLASLCELTVLERKPGEGDIPDPACEYVLSEQEFVFITAATLINKTFPRLLELSKHAFVALVGPSTPLHPRLFDWGIDLLAGTIVNDDSTVIRTIAEGGSLQQFASSSRIVNWFKEEQAAAGGRNGNNPACRLKNKEAKELLSPA